MGSKKWHNILTKGQTCPKFKYPPKLNMNFVHAKFPTLAPFKEAHVSCFVNFLCKHKFYLKNISSTFICHMNSNFFFFHVFKQPLGLEHNLKSLKVLKGKEIQTRGKKQTTKNICIGSL
jgi:hypothetical protein